MIELEGVSPYSQSRMHRLPKLEKESEDARDARTWREKGHYDADNNLVIPAMGLKQALDAVAKYLSERIPGKGQATYSKHFRSGVLVFHDLPVYKDGKPVHRDDMYECGINANADGVRGSGKRVWRRFPQISHPWTAKGSIAVTDYTIEADLLERYLQDVGRFIGLGRFRPENGGSNGRFDVIKFNIQEGLV
jgi:hypothetical protein